MKSSGTICWIVAMISEAKPIINKFGMFDVQSDNRFKVFRDLKGDHWLIISGIGQINCAAATTHLYHVSSANKTTGWINVGIAGCGSGNYGDIYAVDKVQNYSTGQFLFPVCQVSKKQFRLNLLTVDKATNHYKKDELVDMEGFSFFKTVSRFSAKELILVLKVISDGPQNATHELNERKVSLLIHENIEVISKLANRLRLLSTNVGLWASEPKDFETIISRWHFSVSQKIQLKEALRRFESINSKLDLVETFKNLNDGKSIIKKIEERCNKHEIDWSEN